jgi:hypothetical protein
VIVLLLTLWVRSQKLGTNESEMMVPARLPPARPKGKETWFMGSCRRVMCDVMIWWYDLYHTNVFDVCCRLGRQLCVTTAKSLLFLLACFVSAGWYLSVSWHGMYTDGVYVGS